MYLVVRKNIQASWSVVTFEDSHHRDFFLKETERLCHLCWPEFMQSSDVDRWDNLHSAFPAYQFVLVEEQMGSMKSASVVAAGNSIPFFWDGTVEGLPSGWDEVLKQGLADHKAGRRPNTLSALGVMTDPRRRGVGVGVAVLQIMRQIAAAKGLAAMVAPVRPSLKSRYPLTPMEQYVTWKSPQGEHFDPWLRVHARLGAQIIKLATASMTVSATVAEWEKWTAMAFPASGAYVVPGALNPVTVDREVDRVVYVEPNVWMRHSLNG